jgi:outer membrane protein
MTVRYTCRASTPRLEDKRRLNSMVLSSLRVATVAALLITSIGASAQEVSQVPIIDAPQGTPGLGAGIRISGQPYINKSTKTDLVPLYLYQGKYLFAEGTKFGAHLLPKQKTVSLDLLIRYDFSQLKPEDDAYFAGIEEREQSVQGGISGSVQGGWGKLKLEYVTDLLDRHNGQEANLSYRYNFQVGNWAFSPFVTGIWLDDKITDYYYGVSAAEALPDRPAYKPGAAFNFGWGVNSSYHLTDNIFLFGNIGSVGYDSKITRSPLTEENTTYTAFLGAGYLFGDDLSHSRVQYPSENNLSWRVSYGYQAANNIFPRVMSGEIEKSNVADTNLAGFTVGRLFQEGQRVQLWGKLAAYRHLEEPLQKDFWSFNFYMMAIGKGYVPWSEQLAFRYGFGLGFSYAQQVPIAEQLKQESKGENTNRFLNYLEFMVDFPVDRFIKYKWTKNCFLGMTIAHRSGIFATSDILGSVAGGSDWVNLSYECVR